MPLTKTWILFLSTGLLAAGCNDEVTSAPGDVSGRELSAGAAGESSGPPSSGGGPGGTGGFGGASSSGTGGQAPTGGAGASAGGTCSTERASLLAALQADAGSCTTAADCSYFTAWAAPDSGILCNADWPIANGPSHADDLNAKNQSLADCLAAAHEMPPAGPCALASPDPACRSGVCILPAHP